MNSRSASPRSARASSSRLPRRSASACTWRRVAMSTCVREVSFRRCVTIRWIAFHSALPCNIIACIADLTCGAIACSTALSTETGTLRAATGDFSCLRKVSTSPWSTASLRRTFNVSVLRRDGRLSAGYFRKSVPRSVSMMSWMRSTNSVANLDDF